MTLAIPMLNEEGNVDSVLDETFSALASWGLSLQVVCVDDGSSDGTLARLRSRAASEPRLRVEAHRSRRGYGAAIRTGLTQANTEIVGWMDGDAQYDPSDLLELEQALKGDVVAAVGVRQDRADGPIRLALGRLGTGIARTIVRERLLDADAGIKLFRASSLEPSSLRADGSYISTEALRRVRGCGEITQIPVTHRARIAGKQSGASLSVLAGLGRDFIRCNFT